MRPHLGPRAGRSSGRVQPSRPCSARLHRSCAARHVGARAQLASPAPAGNQESKRSSARARIPFNWRPMPRHARKTPPAKPLAPAGRAAPGAGSPAAGMPAGHSCSAAGLAARAVAAQGRAGGLGGVGGLVACVWGCVCGGWMDGSRFKWGGGHGRTALAAGHRRRCCQPARPVLHAHAPLHRKLRSSKPAMARQPMAGRMRVRFAEGECMHACRWSRPAPQPVPYPTGSASAPEAPPARWARPRTAQDAPPRRRCTGRHRRRVSAHALRQHGVTRQRTAATLTRRRRCRPRGVRCRPSCCEEHSCSCCIPAGTQPDPAPHSPPSPSPPITTPSPHPRSRLLA